MNIHQLMKVICNAVVPLEVIYGVERTSPIKCLNPDLFKEVEKAVFEIRAVVIEYTDKKAKDQLGCEDCTSLRESLVDITLKHDKLMDEVIELKRLLNMHKITCCRCHSWGFDHVAWTPNGRPYFRCSSCGISWTNGADGGEYYDAARNHPEKPIIEGYDEEDYKNVKSMTINGRRLDIVLRSI